MARALSFGPVRTSAETATAASRLRLTRRGQRLLATAVVVGLFLLMWAGSAIGYLVTGVSG